MALKKLIENLLEQELAEKPHLFVVDFSVSNSNNVLITLDGDNGITLQDCIDIHKAINKNINEEEYDFSLEVASCGATAPIKNFRQFNKNIGRTLSITTKDNEKFEAVLTGLDGENLLVEWQAREPKKLGKGKETVTKNASISYNNIKEVFVKIIFN